MKNMFICLICLMMLLAFALGLISGYVFILVDDKIADSNYKNLLIIYDIEEERL